MGFETVEDKLIESQAVPLKVLTWIPSELQHKSSSLKGKRDICSRTELSGIRVRAKGQLSRR